MKLLLSCLMLMYGATSAYKMGALITCMEQNDESPIGYRDDVWNDPNSPECLENPDLAAQYQTEPYAGRGDVCDHTDPQTGQTRNACYFNTIFGEEENEEKTWSYKCWLLDRCPLKDANGNGRVGCNINEKRINCCCQEDYCNGDELIRLFAQWGRPDHYPPDFDEICSYDFTGWFVNFDVEGYEHCSHDPDVDENVEAVVVETQDEETEAQVVVVESSPDSDNEEGSDPISVQDYMEQQGYAAHGPEFEQLEKEEEATEASVRQLNNLFFIFAMFFVGVVCLAIGVFIGGKWKTAVIAQEQMLKGQQLDI